jgi:hypothetical protein
MLTLQQMTPEMLVQLNVMLRLPPHVDEDEGYIIDLCMKQSRKDISQSCVHDETEDAAQEKDLLEQAGVNEVVNKVHMFRKLHPSVRREAKALARAIKNINLEQDKMFFQNRGNDGGNDDTDEDDDAQEAWEMQQQEEAQRMERGATSAAVAKLVADATEAEHQQNPWKRPTSSEASATAAPTIVSQTVPTVARSTPTSTIETSPDGSSASAPSVSRRLSAIMKSNPQQLELEANVSRILI